MDKYRYKITVEYDGTDFFGWQRQKDKDSIQQQLEKSLSPIAREIVAINGAGRTDAGVHAYNQVAHFDLSHQIDAFRIKECMNAYLKEVPISVLKVEPIDASFDARFSAKERSYIYKIFNRREQPCIDRNRTWWFINKLDENIMNSAAQHLIGHHDFTTFRAAGCQSRSPMKTVNCISVIRNEDIIHVHISSKSFLYHQVRNIVGSLAYVGCGKWTEDDFIHRFQAKDRKLGGPTAPACGLYFYKATY